MNVCERLLFGTAGIPESAKEKGSAAGVSALAMIGLDAMEIEYVRGSFPGEAAAEKIKNIADHFSIRLTAHAPYYVNLNADDPVKRDSSRRRIRDSAYYGSLSGAESIVFHAGYYLGNPKETSAKRIEGELRHLHDCIVREGLKIDLRPETSGSEARFGSLDELLILSRIIDGIKPCIDWAHLHARTGECNTAGEFASILDRIRSALGDEALKECHMHVSGMEYTGKGEKRHCNLDESDFNYRDLLRVLHDYNVAGFLISESPSQAADARKLKDFYMSL